MKPQTLLVVAIFMLAGCSSSSKNDTTPLDDASASGNTAAEDFMSETTGTTDAAVI